MPGVNVGGGVSIGGVRGGGSSGPRGGSAPPGPSGPRGIGVIVRRPFKAGGSVSARADGCCTKGKTKGKIV